MTAFFLKFRSLWLLSLVTLLLNLICLFYILPANFNWAGYQVGQGDLAQHLSGWYAFIQEPWHFPLLNISLLNYPAGTTISLTDSIPLFALFFKVFRGILPAEFNYFGFFVLFLYFMQSFSALTLAYSVHKNHLLGTLAFVILALSSPIMSIRVGGEDSLACQSLILLALSGYFFARSGQLRVKAWHWFFGILLATSLLIHPYFTPMIYVFYLISFLNLKKDSSASASKVLYCVIFMHGLLVLEYVIMGLGQVQLRHSFGLASMNLLSPFYGGWLAHDQNLVAYPAQQEGFAYLGLGLMAMLGLAIILNFQALNVLTKRYWALIGTGILFFVIATLSHVYIGHYRVMVYQTPVFFLTGDFRTNGRFFWPTWYILMSLGILGLLRGQRTRIPLLILLLILLQLFDVSGYLKSIKNSLRSDFTPSAVNPSIQASLRESKIAVFYPKMACPNMTPTDYQLLASTQLLTSRANLPINTAYIAHFISPNCGDDAPLFPQLNPKLLVSSVDNPSPTIQTLLKTSPHACQLINTVYYCKYSNK